MWILKKDIVTPDYSVKAGTPGTPDEFNKGQFKFERKQGAFVWYGNDYMRKHPDFFEEVKDPEPKEFTRSDMMDFGAFIGEQDLTEFAVRKKYETYLDSWAKMKEMQKAEPATQTDSEKKWSNEQLMSFVTYLVLDIPNAPTMERIENDFENWKKEKGYE